MLTLEASPKMAKKAGRPKTSTGEGPPVRIEADLQSMLKYIAARRGVALAKLASDLLRPAVEREFQKVAPKIEERITPPEDPTSYMPDLSSYSDAHLTQMVGTYADMERERRAKEAEAKPKGRKGGKA